MGSEKKRIVRRAGQLVINVAKILFAQLYLFTHCYHLVDLTSINYGVSHQPIKDISQLMPSLCQNQSVICEGSFCIPGLRKCVCDLRKPVQFGRFCLRQVEIETKCFVTNQCNHTIKDAVCIDLSSNVILDSESSKFKLEQWQQLHELRQASQSVISNRDTGKASTTTSGPPVNLPRVFMVETVNSKKDDFGFNARDDVIISNARNSPYEINYYTPELLQQNHTRRKTNSSDRSQGSSILEDIPVVGQETQNDGLRQSTSETAVVRSSSSNKLDQPTAKNLLDTTTLSTATTERLTTTPLSTSTFSSSPSINDLSAVHTPVISTSTTSLTSELAKKKIIVKPANWPPGECSCPLGYMFDSMLRKCLALSLADSHCQSDNDCRQIRLTHCSSESKKCDCDEPLEWNQTELACVRPRLKTALSSSPGAEKPMPTLLLTELFPDQTVLLLIFIVSIIFGTLIILGLFVKCFSSSKPALISPKNQKHKKGGNQNNSIPKSPYATLRRTDKPAGLINSTTQAARGRILNYDFEQDNPIPDASSPKPPTENTSQHQQLHDSGTIERNGTLSKIRSHKHVATPKAPSPETVVKHHRRKTPEVVFDESVDLNELDSETKSEASILIPPAPPTNNQPTYMLAGQQSAIAAAAAAVANRRNFGKPEFV